MKPHKSILNLQPSQVKSISILVNTCNLTSATRNQLLLLLYLSNQEHLPSSFKISRQTKRNNIIKFSKPKTLESFLNKATNEAKFLEDTESARNSIISKERSDLGFTRTEIQKLAKHLDVVIPRKRDVDYNIKELCQTHHRRSPRGNDRKLQIRDNLIDIAGILSIKGIFVVAIAAHCSKAMTTVFKKQFNLALNSSDIPSWTTTSLVDLLNQKLFSCLNVKPSLSDNQKYPSSCQNSVKEFISEIGKQFAGDWKITYLVDNRLACFFSEIKPVVFCAQPCVVLEKLFYNMINTTLTYGIFPRSVDWFLMIRNLQAKNFSAKSWSQFGSGKLSFTAFRHLKVAFFYWAAQGNLFTVPWIVSSILRSRHFAQCASFTHRPRVEMMQSDLAHILPLPNLGYFADVDDESFRNIPKTIREVFRQEGHSSHAYYLDALETPPHIREFFKLQRISLQNNVGSPQQTRPGVLDSAESCHPLEDPDSPDAEEKRSKKFGWACRLLPRRLIFPDLTASLAKIDGLELEPLICSNSNRVHLADDKKLLVFNGVDLLLGVLEAYASDWYADTVSIAGSWQENSLRALGWSHLAPCDETLEGWLAALPHPAAEEFKSLTNRTEASSNYAFAVALAQLSPFRESFQCDPDLDLETLGEDISAWHKIWASDFRNLFRELDADFLVAGFHQDAIRCARELTQKWVDEVEVVLINILSRDKTGEYTDPGILGFWNLMKQKKQSDLLIEDCIERAKIRLLGYESKIVRITLEGISRQVLAGVEVPVPYFVLQKETLCKRLKKIAMKISAQLMTNSVEKGDHVPLDDWLEDYDAPGRDEPDVDDLLEN